MGYIKRGSELYRSVTVGTSASTDNLIDYGDSAGGMFKPSFTGTVTFFATEDKDTTPLAVHDSTDAAISQAVTASKWYPFPDELYGARYFCMVDSTGGTADVKTKG